MKFVYLLMTLCFLRGGLAAPVENYQGAEKEVLTPEESELLYWILNNYYAKMDEPSSGEEHDEHLNELMAELFAYYNDENMESIAPESLPNYDPQNNFDERFQNLVQSDLLTSKRYLDRIGSQLLPSKRYLDPIGSALLPSKRYLDRIGSQLLPSKRYLDRIGSQLLPSKRYLDPIGSALLPSKRYLDRIGSQLLPSKRYLDPIGSALLPSKRYLDRIGSQLLPSKRYLDPIGSALLPSKRNGQTDMNGVAETSFPLNKASATSPKTYLMSGNDAKDLQATTSEKSEKVDSDAQLLAMVKSLMERN
ncbi:uncharacterized protein [Watersipora subatra]|uniref:uncharacterized protein n=1 Tax=Watersipora subatra TaxID=2589382 RepID=UPI00355B2D11